MDTRVFCWASHSVPLALAVVGMSLAVFHVLLILACSPILVVCLPGSL